ncbi:MAG: trypsin-like peptidase domain-containing protein, partial [Gammaproteobacteria bacterium]|nr:trypsin-like peptidase domain-containing protein [Gammaproteobacteria bacterium]
SNTTTTQNTQTQTNNHQVKFSSPLTSQSINNIGSGFIVSSSGHVLTNYHVVKGSGTIYVTVFGVDGAKNRYQAEAVKLDETKDLALVKINSNRTFIPVVLGDSSQLKIADSVLAIGSPYGLTQTVSRGIVSGIRKSLSIENIVHKNLIQTDAAINQGNSGGPLVDRYAHVIGINTAIYTPTGAFSGIGFAIPSNELQKFIENEINSSTWNVLSKGLLGGLGLSVAAPAGTPPTINANSTPPGSHNDGRKNMVCSTCHQVIGQTNVAFNPNNSVNLGRNVAQGPPISANAGIPGNHKRDGRDKNCKQCHQINGTGKWQPAAFQGSTQWNATPNNGGNAVNFNNGGMLTVAANAGPPINVNSTPPASHRRDGRDKMQCKMCHQVNGQPRGNVVAFANIANQFAVPNQSAQGVNIATANTGNDLVNNTTSNNDISIMGMQLQPLNQAIINALNNPLTEGVFVSSVAANSTASRAGIKAGDIVFKLDGRWISSPQQLKRRLNTYANNDNVRLGIYRDGQRVNRYLVIVLENSVQQMNSNQMPTLTTGPMQPTELNWKGMELKPIIPSLIAKEPQLANTQGVLINDVDKLSVAEAAGLQKGDIVKMINNQTVNTPERMVNAVNQAGQGQTLVKIVRNGTEAFVTLN